MKKYISLAVAVLIWIILWLLAGLMIGDSSVFAGPVETLQSLAQLCSDGKLISAMMAIILLVAAGFIPGVIISILLAALSVRNDLVRTFISPLMAFMKTLPGVCMIVLLLIWMPGDAAQILISLFMTLPIVYDCVLKAVQSSDDELLEMAYVFRMGLADKIRYIYLPEMKAPLRGCLGAALSTAFKGALAASFISQAEGSIGAGLYAAMTTPSAAMIIAWSLAAILAYLIMSLILRLIGECI
ncbi:ABC transporter permease [Butyrivibrio sp. MC2013]|uniref:ABC transporter permease n=1 Tax=Butyrivibrio sp. MC2013 TaxID=1280686 RepID=UPI0003F6846D|nr:ABC transporter permease subunit [Butyrivibrio sp. MC2013]